MLRMQLQEIYKSGGTDMITYDPLWETMKTRGVSQYRLIKNYGVSSGQINRLKKNAYVSTHTIEVLCQILNCRVEDIMQYDEKNTGEKEPGKV